VAPAPVERRPVGALAAFQAPAARAPSDPRLLRRAIRFTADRALRLLGSAVAVPTFAFVLWGPLDRWGMLSALGVAAVLWLPTTAILFRSVFLPSPPDPWLVDDDGRPLSSRDLRATVRATAAEFLLSVVPFVLLLPFVLQAIAVPVPGGMVVGVTLGLLLVVVLRDGRHVLSLWLDDVAIDLAAGLHERAVRRLERLERMPWFRRSDNVRHLLARARFRLGDPAGALAALDDIRDRDGWRVPALRAQMGIAVLGADEVRRTAASMREDPDAAFVGLLLEALADLYEGRADRVLERESELLEVPIGEPRRMGTVLVAAALAEQDPVRARALLRAASWDPARVESLERTWPPIGRRLASLGEW
jgi:hypothetical protein